MTPECLRSNLPSLVAWSVGLFLYPGSTETSTIAKALLERTRTLDAFIITLGLWLKECGIHIELELRTNEESDLSFSKEGNYCGNLGDLHSSCWFILVFWMYFADKAEQSKFYMREKCDFLRYSLNYQQNKTTTSKTKWKWNTCGKCHAILYLSISFCILAIYSKA